MSPAGTEEILYSFGGVPDGAYPNAGLIVVDRTLYGTTYGGGIANNFCGPSGCGTVFKVATSGQETILSRFDTGDGANPIAGLVAVGRQLYGTTYYSNTGDGTVFSVSLSGSERVLHYFTNDPDGVSPTASLIDVGGVLYGTTSYGGYPPGSGNGTVYKISTSGNEKIVYSFGFAPDGLFPLASLTEADGTLYGTTYGGGASECKSGQCGTVFKVTPDGKETILHSFAGGSDGSNPIAAMIDVGGDFYGTTTYGGGTRCNSRSGLGCGTIFRITKSGTESIIYRFTGGADGKYPEAPLVDVGGAFYGTTYAGGRLGGKTGNEYGTVFKVTTGGAETVIHRFTGNPSDGALPAAGLIDFGGTLYGTTVSGGANNVGAVFSIRL